MTQSLDPNCEYLVASDLSETELTQKVAELEEMRRLIENAAFRPMDEHRHRRLQHEREGYYVTFFVVRPEQYVLACVYRPSRDDQPCILMLSVVDEPENEFKPYAWHQSNQRIGFDDRTMSGLENDVPTISKSRALAAIDRWIRLLSSPLPQIAPDEPSPVAVRCARDFIGSVAAQAEKQGVSGYVLPSLDENPVDQELTVSADFPTASQLPQVSFTGWRGDDYGHDYEYLTREAAAIYACALPTLIGVGKTVRRGDGSEEPFGLSFDQWRSPNLPFEPSSAMDPILRHLPCIPVDAVIPPIFSEE